MSSRSQSERNSERMAKSREGVLPESAKISQLNCVDLSSPHIHTSVSLVKQACLDSGFFYVINHGIDEEFMDEVFSQSKRFFTLPLEEKMKLLKNEKSRGYTPLFDETLDPDNQKIGDYKEGYYIGIEVPEGHSDAHKPFYGPNMWPSAGWKETMEKYHEKALKLVLGVGSTHQETDILTFMCLLASRREVGRAVLQLIALALSLDFNSFDQPGLLGEPIAILRLLHYVAFDPAEGRIGAGAHSDYGLITLLATDNNYGLQICKDKDAKPQIWEYIPPLKGAFIVNLGDMLERLSNCYFRSTLHRVLGNGQERYSIAYFVEPNHDYVVECLPGYQSEENPPKFPPIKYQDYLLQRYKETQADLNSYK